MAMRRTGYMGKVVLCGKWMPHAKQPCARWAEHRFECRTRDAMDDAARARRLPETWRRVA